MTDSRFAKVRETTDNLPAIDAFEAAADLLVEAAADYEAKRTAHYQGMTVPALKEAAANYEGRYRISPKGTKADLVARLASADRQGCQATKRYNDMRYAADNEARIVEVSLKRGDVEEVDAAYREQITKEAAELRYGTREITETSLKWAAARAKARGFALVVLALEKGMSPTEAVAAATKEVTKQVLYSARYDGISRSTSVPQNMTSDAEQQGSAEFLSEAHPEAYGWGF
jgi:hypothetical protein